MRKVIFLLATAGAIGAVPTTAAVATTSAKLRLPPPKAPRNQIYSAAAIASDLQKRGYRIEKMKRKGTTYSVTAAGPHKNRVQLTVDGRSGDVVGLAVLQAAANLASAVAAIVKSGKGSRYVDDWHPFGIIIPDTYQTRWVSYPATSWATFTTTYVPEAWSGTGYRFAVPYQTVRPGYGGSSISTFSASEMSDPIYEVYESNGSEITTEYSEETTEITATTEFEEQYSTQDEQLEQSYLGGEVSEGDIDVDDVADYDSEDGDFDVADDSGDGYEADIAADEQIDPADDSGQDVDGQDDDNGQEVDEPDDDNGQADAPDDGGGDDVDDASDGGDDDQADDPGDGGDDADDGGDDGSDGGSEDDPGLSLAYIA